MEGLVAVKTRKPYTITKQREKWTEEEHNLFLEALKLYGRAWQRIEEHIGTKTAVQIRSHAQKFFTKLEKEALEKGIPPGQAHDIDIPPPRPKRKPNNPYPRKSSTGSLAPGDESRVKRVKSILLLGTNDVMDKDDDAHNEKSAPEKQLKTKEISEDPSHSEVLNVFQDDLSVSVSSVNKRSSNNTGEYVEFLPTKRKSEDKIAIDVSSSEQPEVDQGLNKVGKAFTGQETECIQQNCTKPHINVALEKESSTPKLQDKKSMESGREVPINSQHVNIMGKNGANSRQTEDSDGQNPVAASGQSNPNGSNNPVASAIPVHNPSTIGSMHPLIPVFSPFAHLYTSQDAYRPFMNISTFSSLIISTLLQNPALDVATSLATSLCHSGGLESSLKPSPELPVDENSERHMKTTPTLEAVAAVTVAAAAAWWAAQGLLPWLPPGFAFAPPNATMIPAVNVPHPQGHDGGTDNHLKEDEQIGQQNQSDEPKRLSHSSKSLSLSLSSSDSDDRRRDENSNEIKTTKSDEFKPLEASVFDDSGEERKKRKQDRSSCGSNTTSSSDVETDNIKKHDTENIEAREVYFNDSPACGTNDCSFTSSGSMNESRKEVSEEGRLAFQELFKRQVLPQSFSPPSSKEATTTIQNAEASNLPVDLNHNVCSSNDPTHLLYDTHVKKCARSNGSIIRGRLDLHRSGFKPYKRCSIEAKESRTPETDETSNKRVHLQDDDAKSLC